ncbi:3-isopropylmalate dehydratase small subunit [Acidithiobacillus caldus]|uniref:3-isopropylmalate dehydratase small subunit n=2 Tax=Acidithiobacillus caldus TaxID=33059 RepID=UPI001C0708B9|nr:3-isopropylmalate dehydratase small subunit [Acidithiobacillus caldus]MBU2790240.1 3-isopropylmalate dehydratase small subunit [Acidithiobacillus caldus]
MKAFTVVESVLIPLDRANVDTDAIIPKQFLKTIERQGLGRHLFHDWRYAEDGTPRADFVLNRPPYSSGQILLARENFGCGSSREHAPWALQDFGIRAVVASSFADIFANNCVQNGILTVTLDADRIEELFQAVQREPGYRLRIDLEQGEMVGGDGWRTHFSVAPGTRHKLLHGLDDIEITLQHKDAIARYEAQRRQQFPWLFRG